MPRLVIYYNDARYPLASIASTPFTHVILAFLVPGASDPMKVEPSGNLADTWPDVAKLQQAGKKVLISLGGATATHAAYQALATDVPGLVQQIVELIDQHGLDGVDIDFEDTAGFESSSPYDGVSFLVELSQQLAVALPAGRDLLTHAPQPPYFSPGFLGGPYLEILRQVAAAISWINLQYYNNSGFDAPEQITGLSAEPFVSSVTGLARGVGGLKWPVNKTVVGKPVATNDAGSGYLPPDQLVSEVVTPLAERYGAEFGGVMGWQYAQDAAENGAWHSALASALELA